LSDKQGRFATPLLTRRKNFREGGSRTTPNNTPGEAAGDRCARALLQRLGFAERIRGSHHIFCKEGAEEILNLQPKGSKAKPYQVKQVRHVILKYKLGGGRDA
jgi:hypothetical protein